MQRVPLGIISAALVVRLAAAFYLGNAVEPMPGIFDQISYHTLALRVLNGHGFTFGIGWWPATAANEPTAHWSFLYVLFLAAVYGVAGPNPLAARVFQAAAVGVLQPLLTWRIARRLFGPRVGLLAATVVAGYAYFVYYAGALVTESLYCVTILWALDTALILAGRIKEGRPSRIGAWLHLAIALAVAVQLRQVILLVVPAILAWVAWQATGGRRVRSRWRQQRAGLLAGTALTLTLIVGSILPWTVRNYRVFNQFVPLNTNAGFALFWGNHPVHGSDFVPILRDEDPSYGALIPDELKGLNEAQMDRALLQRGLDFIAEDPGRFVLLSMSRVREYVKFWPSGDSGTLSNVARVLSFGLCLPFLLWGVLMTLRRQLDGRCHENHPGVWLLLGVALAYSLIHFLTWTLVRYRLPVDAVLMPFVALALAQVCNLVWTSRAAIVPLRTRLEDPREV